jgi:uncharacterized protein with NRDE domain
MSNCDPARPHEAAPAQLHVSPVATGLHTLSNASLDTPWPKARRLAEAVGRALTGHDNADAWLAQALTDTQAAPDAELPRSGVPIEIERALSSPFVQMPQRAYGTRCSSVLRWHADGRLQFDEWTHAVQGDRPSFAAAAHRREQLTVA